MTYVSGATRPVNTVFEYLSQSVPNDGVEYQDVDTICRGDFPRFVRSDRRFRNNSIRSALTLTVLRKRTLPNVAFSSRTNFLIRGFYVSVRFMSPLTKKKKNPKKNFNALTSGDRQTGGHVTTTVFAEPLKFGRRRNSSAVVSLGYD